MPWVLHREGVCTQKEGPCNLYFLLNAYSGYCFGPCLTVDLPSRSEVLSLLREACFKIHRWPKEILIDKKEPYREILKSLGNGLSVPIPMLPFKDLKAWVQPLSEGLKENCFTMDTRSASPEEQET